MWAQTVAEWRKKNGYSETMAAAVLEVEPVTIQRWEAGRNLPYRGTRHRVAPLLGLSQSAADKICEASKAGAA